MLIEVLLYSLSDLNAFRFRKKEIRRLIRDKSMLSVYKIIQGIADDPANRKLTSIPFDVIESKLSRQNKYYEQLKKFNIKDSQIINKETYNVAIDDLLIDITNQKIQEEVLPKHVKEKRKNERGKQFNLNKNGNKKFNIG